MSTTSAKRAVVAVIAAALILPVLSAGSADARGKRKRKKAKTVKVTKENERALAELMGEFSFGMSKKEVLKKLSTEIQARYEERIKATSDVYRQDELRRKRGREIERIRESFIEFKGERTGWDVSIIDDQFAHNTGESMMVYWENVDGKDQRRFFFFHDGKLYKMFIALNSGMLKDEQRKFSYFRKLMETRYGPAKVEYALKDGEEKPVSLVWSTKKYSVRALDRLDFYGSLCLVVANPKVQKKIVAARARVKQPKRRDSVIDSVISKDENESPEVDSKDSSVDDLIR